MRGSPRTSKRCARKESTLAAANGTPMSSSRTDGLRRVPEWQAPTLEQFRSEIVPARRPAVLRGIALDWGLVVAARADPHQCMAILSALANGVETDLLRADLAEE